MSASLHSQQASFELLCSCVAQPYGLAETLADRIEAHPDWAGFLAQLRWHRVAGLVLPVLRHHRDVLPAHVLDAVEREHRQQVMHALRYSAELGRLQAALGARVPYLVLKGQPLSQQLYDDPHVRFAKDIDLLIDESDLDRAHDQLSALGYRRTLPAPDAPPHVMAVYPKFRKDYTYWHPELDTQIELHWRLEVNPHFLPMASLAPFADLRQVTVAGAPQPVLRETSQFLYLVMHVASSSWARLSWLTDLLHLVQQPLDWTEVREQARALRLQTSLDVTLQLLERCFGVTLPPKLREGARTTGLRLSLLTAGAHRCLIQNRYPSGVAMPALRVMTCSSAAFLTYDLRWYLGLSINDVAVVALPRALFPLYYPLRPLLWLLRWLPHTGVAKRQISA
jgi:hypothetical protein